MDPEQASQLVAELRSRHAAYMAALKRVVDLGDSVVPLLVSALDEQAAPIAIALQQLMIPSNHTKQENNKQDTDLF